MVLCIILLAVPEANEDFKIINIIKNFNLMLQLGSSLLLYQVYGYIGLFFGLSAGRYFSLIITIIFIKKYIYIRNLSASHTVLREIVTFGGWITVSSIVSPIMSYFDRYFLAAVSGASSVAIYSLPADLIRRLNLASILISRTFFPYFSENSNNALKYLSAAKVATFVIFTSVLFVALMLFAYGENILLLWLGYDYVDKTLQIFNILIVGLVFNGWSQAPLLILQTTNKVKLPAVFHLFEVIPYMILFVVLVEQLGVAGAAYSWSIRTFVDFLLLSLAAGRELQFIKRN